MAKKVVKRKFSKDFLHGTSIRKQLSALSERPYFLHLADRQTLRLGWLLVSYVPLAKSRMLFSNYYVILETCWTSYLFFLGLEFRRGCAPACSSKHFAEFMQLNCVCTKCVKFIHCTDVLNGWVKNFSPTYYIAQEGSAPSASSLNNSRLFSVEQPLTRARPFHVCRTATDPRPKIKTATDILPSRLFFG